MASGHWPLFRFDPRLGTEGSFPLQLDSKKPTIAFGDYAYEETRYRVLKTLDPEAAARLAGEAQHDIDARWEAVRDTREPVRYPMTTQVFVPVILGLVLAVYLGIAVRTWRRLRGRHVVVCPETHTLAAVTVDLGHATTTAVWDTADVRLATCSRWPERKGCDEGCAAQIAASPERTRVPEPESLSD